MYFKFGTNSSIGFNFGLGSSAPANAASEFITTWNTAEAGSANNAIVLPLEDTGTYDFVADWGDGNNSHITLYTVNSHVYASPGIYTVKITGTINGWRFNNGGDKLKLSNIQAWGPLLVGNNGGYFRGCSNMTCNANDTLDVRDITNLDYMFQDCNLFNQDIGDWDVSKAQTMNSTFLNCAAFNHDIGNWDTANVDYMIDTFDNCNVFNQNIGTWNTANVINMYAMLRNCFAFDQDLGSWDITKVINMAYMFDGDTLSTANYDSLLIGWDAQVVQPNVNFHGGNSKYSAGATARADLISTYTWTITDGGPA